MKLKVTEHASEINRLVRLTSSEISSASASEVTPEHFRRPARPFHSKGPPSLHSPSQEIKGEPVSVYYKQVGAMAYGVGVNIYLPGISK